VSPAALLPGSFPGAYFIATITLPSSNLGQVSAAIIDAGVIDAPTDLEVSMPANRWRNVVQPEDVNANGMVEPLDALTLLNLINSGKANLLSTRDVVMPPYYDVDNDGRVSPLDVLSVINYLNRTHEREIAPEGESPFSWFMAVTPLAREEVSRNKSVYTSWGRENFNSDNYGRLDGSMFQSEYQNVKQAGFRDILDRPMVGTGLNRSKLRNTSESLWIESSYPSHHDAVFAELGLCVA